MVGEGPRQDVRRDRKDRHFLRFASRVRQNFVFAVSQGAPTQSTNYPARSLPARVNEIRMIVVVDGGKNDQRFDLNGFPIVIEGEEETAGDRTADVFTRAT